jgi:hypothetical protein
MKTKYEKEHEDILQKINKLEKVNKHMKKDMKKEKFPEGGLVYIVDYTDEGKTHKDHIYYNILLRISVKMHKINYVINDAYKIFLVYFFYVTHVYLILQCVKIVLVQV